MLYRTQNPPALTTDYCSVVPWKLRLGAFHMFTGSQQFSFFTQHYNDVIMSSMASQITSLPIVYSSVYSRRRSKKTSKLRVTGLCDAVNSPRKAPVTRKIFPFDDVIMKARFNYTAWDINYHLIITGIWNKSLSIVQCRLRITPARMSCLYLSTFLAIIFVLNEK